MRRLSATALLAVAALAAAGRADDLPFRQGFFIGTMANPFDGTSVGADVVKDGVLESWTVGHPYTVPNIVNYVDLFLSLDHVKNMSSFQNVTLDWQLADGTFALKVFLEGSELITKDTIEIGSGYQQQKRLHFQIDCTNSTAVGAAGIDFDLGDDFESVSLSFRYNCSGSHNFFYGFDVSTAKTAGGKGDVVVQNGITVDDLSLSLPEGRSGLDVYVYLNNLSPGDKTQEFDAVADYDDVVMKVTLKPFDGVVSKDKRTPLFIEFECKPSYRGPNRNVAVTITFLFPGKAGGQAYEDAYFDFVKECPHYTSGGGWSGFGIFCFVVFILTLVFCLVGCAINRFHFHKSGLDIVPGAPLVEKYCLKRDSTAYGPQADFEDGPSGAAVGAASYGATNDGL